jgi:hypothetical protein
MNIPLDQLLVVSLTSICIIFSFRSIKNHDKKTNSIITITTACITLAIYFFSDYNNSRQQKELIAIHAQQLSTMETALGDKINALQANNRIAIKQLQDCQNKQIQTVVGRNNNTSQQQGNNNNSNQVQGHDNIGVSGTANTVLTIKGSDGSTINYNTLDKPYFEKETEISQYTNTGIAINKGEQIFITATGSISVGPIVGSSGPDGLGSGFMGASLESYNIVPNFKHAALMYKLSQADDWIQCGSNYKFKADKFGFLIFQVNDNDQGNNSGSYKVTVQKYKNAN